MEVRDTGAGFMAGLFIGIAIGAGLALVLAPRSGEEVRELLLERTEALRDQLEETATAVKGAFEEGMQAAGGPPRA